MRAWRTTRSKVDPERIDLLHPTVGIEEEVDDYVNRCRARSIRSTVNSIRSTVNYDGSITVGGETLFFSMIDRSEVYGEGCREGDLLKVHTPTVSTTYSIYSLTGRHDGLVNEWRERGQRHFLMVSKRPLMISLDKTPRVEVSRKDVVDLFFDRFDVPFELAVEVAKNIDFGYNHLTSEGVLSCILRHYDLHDERRKELIVDLL